MNLLQNFDLNIDDIYLIIKKMREEKEQKKFQPKKLFKFLNPFKKSESNINNPRTSHDINNQFESFTKLLDSVIDIDDKVVTAVRVATPTELLIEESRLAEYKRSSDELNSHKEDTRANYISSSNVNSSYSSDNEPLSESKRNYISTEAIGYDTGISMSVNNLDNLSESRQLLATNVYELNDLTPPGSVKYVTKKAAKMKESDQQKYLPRSAHDLQQLQPKDDVGKRSKMKASSKNFQTIDLLDEFVDLKVSGK
jgi:hypothetical protein